MLQWLFKLVQVGKDCQSAITATLQVIATAILLLKLLLARYSIKHSCRCQCQHRTLVLQVRVCMIACACGKAGRTAARVRVIVLFPRNVTAPS